MLKKQLLKHPVGKARRLEVIAEAFQGRHKKRKPVDKRIEDVGNGGNLMAENGGIRKVSEGGDGGGDGWSSGEDIALLNALKAFPKDVPVSWQKIVACVPGKSKAALYEKRFSEL
ncbi:hypothetical protein FEM48_Zijuj11G0079500 [Ziziphus jujuba var. spinosa]|uniref:Myb-like domain-containing protein n=1 Tax=Ziziphus jujuba var. spinosa TaxID=714518 RepID=A0A978UHR6_ZIZJJ|nr:hypothetical protein FEM48_Zijuj11G0079500 [Ziziphus jujuba var. spinosa]